MTTDDRASAAASRSEDHEFLLAAFDQGYFDTPRRVTLDHLAEQFGLTHREASERLRRGVARVLEHSLRTGRPAHRRSGHRDRVPVEAAFELLGSEQRRHVLHYLTHRREPVELRELARELAAWEASGPEDHERIAVHLHHVHLPKLDAAGVVRYDPVERSVERTDRAKDLAPYLELAARDDAPAGTLDPTRGRRSD